MSIDWRKLNRVAPSLTLAALVGLLAFGGIDAQEIPGAQEYHARVREAVARIPYRIGPWVGEDVDTPPAAVQLLKPNKLLQRRYTDPATGESFSLLFVHCGDTRDMLGHYPPRCYPVHGWTTEIHKPSYFDLSGERFACTLYEFSQLAGGVPQRIVIFGFFVLPNGSVAADMKDLDALATQRSVTALGAAQVQLLIGAAMPVERRREILHEVVKAIEPTIRTVAEGAGDA